jgi:hypothetical protein
MVFVPQPPLDGRQPGGARVINQNFREFPLGLSDQ